MTYKTGCFLVSIYCLLFWGEQVPVPSGYELSLGEPFPSLLYRADELLCILQCLAEAASIYKCLILPPHGVGSLFSVLSSTWAHAGLPEWYLAFSQVSLCGSAEAQSKLTYWLWWFWHPWLPRTTWFAWILQFPELCLTCPQTHKACRGTTQVFEGPKRSNTKKKKSPFQAPRTHPWFPLWAQRHFLQMSPLLMAAVRVHVGICTKFLIWYFSSDCNEDGKVSFRASFLFVLWKMKCTRLSVNEIITCLLH